MHYCCGSYVFYSQDILKQTITNAHVLYLITIQKNWKVALLNPSTDTPSSQNQSTENTTLIPCKRTQRLPICVFFSPGGWITLQRQCLWNLVVTETPRLGRNHWNFNMTDGSSLKSREKSKALIYHSGTSAFPLPVHKIQYGVEM